MTYTNRVFTPTRSSGLKMFVVVLLSLLAWESKAQLAVPELWGTPVHDEANVLKHETVDELEMMLRAHEDSTGNQIAILIINSLENEVLEAYSLRVAETWKLGSAKNDNGVLLLVSITDHAIRIEVGQGLEGALTDAMSSRIIRNEIAPEFRRGDYDAGVLEGTRAIIDVIKGEYVAEEPDTMDLDIGMRIAIGLFVFFVLGMFTLTSVMLNGAIGWVLYVFLIPFYAAFPWIAIGVPAATVLIIVYIIAIPILKIIAGRSPKWQAKMKKWQASEGTSGSFRGSSGSSWGSSSGGGFSGGGGSFGGGGASGGW